MCRLVISCFLALCSVISFVICKDVTDLVFGPILDAVPAAYGNFDSDELIDIFIIRNNSRTMEILFVGKEDSMLFRARHGFSCHFTQPITSVVPGDFNGDSYMDVVVTVTVDNSDLRDVYINWGGFDDSQYLSCADDGKPSLIRMHGEPLALDYDGDMVLDLFGLEEADRIPSFWVFGGKQELPKRKPLCQANLLSCVKPSVPNAHAILDLNQDNLADLFITTETHYEIWNGTATGERPFVFGYKIELPTNCTVGQAMFMDVELTGKLNLMIPICFDELCKRSEIHIHSGEADGVFENLHVSFKDTKNHEWGFDPPEKGKLLAETITIRSADYNMDGYPDLIVTLVKFTEPHATQTFLLENVSCHKSCGRSTRTFTVLWHEFDLRPDQQTLMGSFFDFSNDGVLDVILVEKIGNTTKLMAIQKTTDSDTNFLKIMVVTGPKNKSKNKRGTNLPGPLIKYEIKKTSSDKQEGAAAQLSQSAYFALQLPFTIFGLGRTPNYIDKVTVGVCKRSRTWDSQIPNSQMIIVPWPIDEPAKWTAQLFMIPSKLIRSSILALAVICLINLGIIVFLHLKEKRDEMLEQYNFPFIRGI